MSTPVDFLQRILGEVNEAGMQFGEAKLIGPRYRRQQEVLDKLKSTELQGQELAITKTTQDIEAGMAELKQKQAENERQQQVWNALGAPDAQMAPEGMDPGAWRQEQERRTGVQQTQDLNAARIRAAAPQVVDEPLSTLLKQRLGIDVAPGTQLTSEQWDTYQRALSGTGSGRGGSAELKPGDPGYATGRYGAMEVRTADGRVVLLDQQTGDLINETNYYKSPPGIPGGPMDKIQGLASTREVVSGIRAALDKGVGALGPVQGRLADLSLEYLGGTGLDPETVQALVDIRRGTITEAFANGGKQLTPTEKVEFFKLYPQPTDNLQTALVKLTRAEQFLNEKLALSVEVLSPFQRAAVSERFGGTSPRRDVEFGSGVNTNASPAVGGAESDEGLTVDEFEARYGFRPE